MLPLNGLTQASQPIISYNYGAGKPDRVRRAFWLLLRCAMIYAGVLWATTMLFPQMYIGMFTPDQELIAYAIPAVRIYMAASLLFGIQLSCQQTFVALGNAKNSLFLAVLRKLILLIPLIYLLPALLPDKVTAVFLAEPVARHHCGDGYGAAVPGKVYRLHAGNGRKGGVPACLSSLSCARRLRSCTKAA